MKPSVLIVEDSPSTADLARLALEELSCEVEVAGSPRRALELVRGQLSPWVMVVDPYLPGVQPVAFCLMLSSAVPGAAILLLLDRGFEHPQLPLRSRSMFKPLPPRRFATMVGDLLDEHEDDSEDRVAAG